MKLCKQHRASALSRTLNSRPGRLGSLLCFMRLCTSWRAQGLRGRLMHACAPLMTGPRVALQPSSLSPFFLKLISKEWCAYLVFGIRVGAVGQEELHHRHKAVLCSEMEGRLAILRGGEEGDKARAMREHETRAKHSTGGHD